jgi:hypothetical protein
MTARVERKAVEAQVWNVARGVVVGRRSCGEGRVKIELHQLVEYIRVARICRIV